MSTPTPPDYAMGYTEGEYARLVRQAGLLESTTRDAIAAAGLRPGMRVLDVGCGMGDVAFLAAEAVSSGGHVVGIDRDPRAVHQARARVDGRAVSFEQADVASIDVSRLGGPFDAVIGRYVLVHQPDAVAFVRSVLPALRPGAVVTFIEPEFEPGVATNLDLPEVERARQWIMAICARAGLRMRMGTGLPRVFREAGLPWPEMRMTAIHGGGADYVGYQMYADVLDSLAPLGEKFGIVTREEMDLPTLSGRIRSEAERQNAGLLFCLTAYAIARLPE